MPATLKVTVFNAIGLRRASRKGSSQPYVECQVEGRPDLGFKTRPQQHPTDPNWNEDHELKGVEEGEALHFRVRARVQGESHSSSGGKVRLGHATLASDEFYHTGFWGELALEEAGDGQGAGGSEPAILRVQIEVSHDAAEPEEDLGRRLPDGGYAEADAEEEEDGEEDAIARRAAPFQLPGVEEEDLSPVDRCLEARTLRFRALAAYGLDLPGAGPFGEVGGPFVVARTASAEQRTPTGTNTGWDPIWPEGEHELVFDLGPEDAELQLEVVYHNMVVDESLGSTVLDLRSLPLGEWCRRREPLRGPSGELEFAARLEPQDDGASPGGAASSSGWPARAPPPPTGTWGPDGLMEELPPTGTFPPGAFIGTLPPTRTFGPAALGSLLAAEGGADPRDRGMDRDDTTPPRLPGRPSGAKASAARRLRVSIAGAKLRPPPQQRGSSSSSSSSRPGRDTLLGCSCEVPGKLHAKFQTDFTDEATRPIWNHSCEFDYAPGDPLRFQLLQKRVWPNQPKVLAEAELQSERFYPGGFQGELLLGDVSTGEAIGRLAVTVGALAAAAAATAGSFTEASPAMTSSPAEAPRSPTRSLRPVAVAALQPPRRGAERLRVALLSARPMHGGPPRGAGGSLVCCCEVVGRPVSHFQTESARGREPVWNLEHDIVDYVAGDTLEFSLYDVSRAEGPGDDASLLGTCALRSAQFHPYGFNAELTLSHPGTGIWGFLRVKVALPDSGGPGVTAPRALPWARPRQAQAPEPPWFDRHASSPAGRRSQLLASPLPTSRLPAAPLQAASPPHRLSPAYPMVTAAAPPSPVVGTAGFHAPPAPLQILPPGAAAGAYAAAVPAHLQPRQLPVAQSAPLSPMQPAFGPAANAGMAGWPIGQAHPGLQAMLGAPPPPLDPRWGQARHGLEAMLGAPPLDPRWGQAYLDGRRLLMQGGGP